MNDGSNESEMNIDQDLKIDTSKLSNAEPLQNPTMNPTKRMSTNIAHNPVPDKLDGGNPLVRVKTKDGDTPPGGAGIAQEMPIPNNFSVKKAA